LLSPSSQEIFVDFCTKVSEDEDLAKQLEAVKTPADIVALGAQSGFAFSEADIKEGSQELAEQSERELSEDELTSVSGGKLSFPRVIAVIGVGKAIYDLGKAFRWW
jgi:predicted ribosomally synthesized peptide with nif11-like leader